MVAQMDPMTPQVAVIGSMLIEPKLVGEVLTKVGAEDFSDSRCQIIFQTISSLFYEGQPVDGCNASPTSGAPSWTFCTRLPRRPM